MAARTMLYLEPDQLRALKTRAKAQHISVAELVRRVVRQYLAEPNGAAPVADEAYARLVGLGSSGRSDVGDDHDRKVAEALTREHLR